MKNKYESEILQVIHEDMKGMHRLGIIDDDNMREFDEMCLVEEDEIDYKEIPVTREGVTAILA